MIARAMPRPWGPRRAGAPPQASIRRVVVHSRRLPDARCAGELRASLRARPTAGERTSSQGYILRRAASLKSVVMPLLLLPPQYDWTKLGEPVRLNCRDETLQLLDEPQAISAPRDTDLGPVRYRSRPEISAGDVLEERCVPMSPGPVILSTAVIMVSPSCDV